MSNVNGIFLHFFKDFPASSIKSSKKLNPYLNTNSNIHLSLSSCDAIIVPGKDIHQLETPMPSCKFRHILSGFDGSAGTLVIHKNGNAALYTDSRYTIAVKKKFASPTTKCFISHEQDYNAQMQWVQSQNKLSKTNNTKVNTIIICPLLHTVSQYNLMCQYAKDIHILLIPILYSQLAKTTQNFLQHKKYKSTFNTALVPTSYIKNTDPKKILWNLDTVTKNTPRKTFYKISHKISHKRTNGITASIIKYLKTKKATHMFISNIHEIAYITRLRSTVLANLLLFPSLLIFGIQKKCTFFVPKAFLTPPIKKIINAAFVRLECFVICMPYELLFKNPTSINNTFSHVFFHNPVVSTPKIIYDPLTCPQVFLECLQHCVGINNVLAHTSPITIKKDIRSTQELSLIKKANIQDCAVILDSITDVVRRLENNKNTTEQNVADIILSKRKLTKGFIKESFPTISASGKNSASPHYAYCRNTGGNTLDMYTPYLLDCGAHYACPTHAGTTDITRTFLFALLAKSFSIKKTSQKIQKKIQDYKNDYTAVLKAHITLVIHTFVYNTTGADLDTVTRDTLFAQNKRTYAHGTGHGVGFCSDVHEGSVGIHTRATQAIHKNNVISNEPGYYVQGKWGIRLENLIVTTKTHKQNTLYCKTISFFPFQESLINKKTLTKKEYTWFRAYQNTCKKLLTPLISKNAKELFFPS